MYERFARVTPRIAVVAALLALLPVVLFGFLKPEYLSATVTAVNVVLIGTCLFLLFSPTETERHGSETP